MVLRPIHAKKNNDLLEQTQMAFARKKPWEFAAGLDEFYAKAAVELNRNGFLVRYVSWGDLLGIYPLVNVYITMENHHF